MYQYYMVISVYKLSVPKHRCGSIFNKLDEFPRVLLDGTTKDGPVFVPAIYS